MKKGKFVLMPEALRLENVWGCAVLTWASGSEWSASRFDRFTPGNSPRYTQDRG